MAGLCQGIVMLISCKLNKSISSSANNFAVRNDESILVISVRLD